MPAGRPPKSPEDRKTVIVSCALTEKEVATLEALAKTVRNTRSGYAAYLLVRAINEEVKNLLFTPEDVEAY